MRNKAIIDDGCNPELVLGASFDGGLELPAINPPKDLSIPSNLTPFLHRECALGTDEAICFFEYDYTFSQVLKSPQEYIEDLKRFKYVMPLDCSLYVDAPLPVQITNLYRSRMVGSYLQRHGINIIPLVRWGNDLTYTTKYFPEKIAFLGIPRNSIIAISTYGVMKKRKNRHFFQQGFAAMVSTLTPKVILVYGSMPRSVFAPYLQQAKFVHYMDWITRKHKESC